MIVRSPIFNSTFAPFTRSRNDVNGSWVRNGEREIGQLLFGGSRWSRSGTPLIFTPFLSVTVERLKNVVHILCFEVETRLFSRSDGPGAFEVADAVFVQNHLP